ncbi:MAG: hypothetical protein QGH60_01820 [Phycisphaerae bacterium]|jgi:hypothetical protein|nr:hypothetical protein [Phycisphaerae bacterium]
MTRITIGSVLVMMCASFALGATGDLTFVKQPLSTTYTSLVYVTRFTHGGADKTLGLVNQHSVVGVAAKNAGGMHVAIDSVKADATQSDVIRLDFSGQGKFKDAPTAQIKIRPARSGTTMGAIGPVVVIVKRGGRSIPVAVRGHYWKQATRRGLSLMLSAVMEGTCKFGAKTYPVRVVDGNANLGFSDALKPPFSPRARMPFDKIVVDTGDGKFSSAATTSYVGQPVFVDGKWYSIDIADMKITASPQKITGGSVKASAPRWQCTLIGKKNYLTLNGGTEPIAVPADEYRTSNYTVFNGSDPLKRSGTIRGYGSFSSGKTFTVASGKTAELSIGAPIEATVVASMRGAKVNMNLMMKDALGGRIRSITTNEGKRPPAPSIEVVDKAGKIVYTAKLKYG